MSDVEKEIQAGDRKLAEGDFQGALSRFKKAIKLDPNTPEAHFGKAEAALGVPKVPLEEVIADYKRAIELAPDNPFFRARLGSFCLEVGEWDMAEESYRQAAEVDPENAYLYFSEFGLEFFHTWRMRNEEEADDSEREAVAKKSLGYMLRSMYLDEEDARRLLG